VAEDPPYAIAPGVVKVIDFVAPIKIAWPKNICWSHKEFFSTALSRCPARNAMEGRKALEVDETKTSSHRWAEIAERFSGRALPRKTGVRWRKHGNNY
jgi:hypothetical protein